MTRPEAVPCPDRAGDSEGSRGQQRRALVAVAAWMLAVAIVGVVRSIVEAAQ